MVSLKLVVFLGAASAALVACSALLGDFTVGSGGGPTDAAAAGDAPTGADGGPNRADAADSAAPRFEAVSVSAGRAHTCAINVARDIFCWGSNASGQLGVPISQTARSSIPVKVPLVAKAIAVAAGAFHTCAIVTGGRIQCWGANDRAQLGRDTSTATEGIDFVSDPVGGAAIVAIWKNAEVLTAGASFTCAGVTQGMFQGHPDRRFFCWGENLARQCGTSANNGSPNPTPSLITMNGDDRDSPQFEGSTISAGADFACAASYIEPGAERLSVAGCWGSRSVGQLGSPMMADSFEVNPNRAPSRLPDGGFAPVFGPLQSPLLATGDVHGCSRMTGTTPVPLTCWGNNSDGQTGGPVSAAQPAAAVPAFDATDVQVLAAGGRNTCVVANGVLQCIGANDVGQLGRGSSDILAHATFANVATLPPSVSAVAIGTSHMCAVVGGAAGQPGPVSCWGQNQNGQLGDGLDVELGYASEPDATKRIRTAPVFVAAPRTL